MRYCYHNDTLWAQTSGRSRTRHGRGRDARMWSAHCFRIKPTRHEHRAAIADDIDAWRTKAPIATGDLSNRPPLTFRSVLRTDSIAELITSCTRCRNTNTCPQEQSTLWPSVFNFCISLSLINDVFFCTWPILMPKTRIWLILVVVSFEASHAHVSHGIISLQWNRSINIFFGWNKILCQRVRSLDFYLYGLVKIFSAVTEVEW